MGCNCGGSAKRAGRVTSYKATRSSGETKTFLTDTEARIWVAQTGGTIVAQTKPV